VNDVLAKTELSQRHKKMLERMVLPASEFIVPKRRMGNGDSQLSNPEVLEKQEKLQKVLGWTDFFGDVG